MISEARQVWSAAEIVGAETAFVHSADREAQCRIAPLSRLGGLSSIGLNLVTVAPGRKAFPLHRHHVEEEWTYVVSGRAEVRIGQTTQDVGPGGFVSFPAGGEAHSVTNASPDEPLVCLMGGVTVAADLVDFPDLGLRVVKSGLGTEAAGTDAFAPFRFRARPETEESGT